MTAGSFTPRVSIGLPVYNGEKYLANALEGLLGQDFEDFELIVCDNASTDRTADICAEFARKDPRLRYFRNEKNIGLAANANRTFAFARGQFFKWAAHDDEFPRAMLRRFVQAIEGLPPSVCLVYSRCEYINERGEVGLIDSDHVDTNTRWPHRRLAHFLAHVHMYNFTYGLMRSAVLRKTRGHGLFPMSDHVLWAELAMLGEMVEIPEPLIRIRVHPERSFAATKDPAVLRKIFNPGHGQREAWLSLKARVNFELLRSTLGTPATLRDKVLCAAVAAIVPPWLMFRAFGGRQRRKVVLLLGKA